MKLRAVSGSLMLSALLGAAACSPWVPVNGPTPQPFLEIDVSYPNEWFAFIWSHGTYITRQGKELQAIHIRRWPRTQIVKGTGRSIGDGMLPLQIAEVSLDSRRHDDGVAGLVVESNEPAQVGGRDCYRIQYRYRNEINLPMQTVEYGCAVGAWMYRFEYNAAEQYYFDANVADFEAMIRTVAFLVKVP